MRAMRMFWSQASGNVEKKTLKPFTFHVISGGGKWNEMSGVSGHICAHVG